MKLQLDFLTRLSITISLEYSSNVILSSSTFSYYFYATILKAELFKIFKLFQNYSSKIYDIRHRMIRKALLTRN
jgi:hypothetical protein